MGLLNACCITRSSPPNPNSNALIAPSGRQGRCRHSVDALSKKKSERTALCRARFLIHAVRKCRVPAELGCFFTRESAFWRCLFEKVSFYSDLFLSSRYFRICWALGAVVSASRLHRVGRGFESLSAHQPFAGKSETRNPKADSKVIGNTGHVLPITGFFQIGTTRFSSSISHWQAAKASPRCGATTSTHREGSFAFTRPTR
jgi:hypothetical protein